MSNYTAILQELLRDFKFPKVEIIRATADSDEPALLVGAPEMTLESQHDEIQPGTPTVILQLSHGDDGKTLVDTTVVLRWPAKPLEFTQSELREVAAKYAEIVNIYLHLKAPVFALRVRSARISYEVPGAGYRMQRAIIPLSWFEQIARGGWVEDIVLRRRLGDLLDRRVNG